MNTLRLLWRNRALISVLVRRELNARYRASVLGYVWSLVNPLLLLAIYTVVFTTIFQPRMGGAQPYGLFLFAGLLPWLFFSGAMLDSAVTLVDNAPLLAQVVCPPEVFPAVTVASHFVHHVLALPVLVAALGVAAAVGAHPFPWTIVLLPVALVPWVLVTGGLTLAVSALAVHFRDLRDLVGNLLNLLFFGSAIIYTLEALPSRALYLVIRFNPLVSLVRIYRELAFSGQVAPALDWVVAFGAGVVCWTFGSVVFGRLRDTVAEAV